MTVVVDHALLSRQNADTSNAVLELFANDPCFARLAEREGESISRRDAEDDVKLQAGIDLAKKKGVLDPDHVAEPYEEIDVLGRTPDEVANAISERVRSSSSSDDDGDSRKRGEVVVLCGLSGTGKGTTVAKLKEGFEAEGRRVVCWSNGNIFRSVTLLAVTWARRNDVALDAALDKDRLASFLSMLSFDEQDDGTWDTTITGLDGAFDGVRVSSVQNTTLKSPDVSTNIPAVAEVTQGEVVAFAAEAIERMVKTDADVVVLLEGRRQTVDFVRSPHRFVLTLSDKSLIGRRRAAQRVGAAASQRVRETDDEETVRRVLVEELNKMA